MKIASGILPIAASTKEICLAWRSPAVNAGNRYGIIGGMLKPGQTVEEGALDELGEEMGYYGPIELHSAFVYTQKGFAFHSFVGIVPEPFVFAPEAEYAWETSFIKWVKYPEVKNMLETNPHQFHKGLRELFQESKSLIESFV